MTEQTACCGFEIDTGNTPPEWVHILPAGTFRPDDGRGPWTNDDPRGVIARSLKADRRMPIDYEHQMDHAPKNGKPAPAAGWIVGMKPAPDGIWAQVEWTERAAAALAAKEYRYLSPVFTYTKDGKVVRILRAGLTNAPALEMAALAKTEDSTPEVDDDVLRSALCIELGLPRSAGADEIVEATRAVVRASDPRRFVPADQVEAMLRDQQESTAAARDQRTSEKVALAVSSGILPPALRNWGAELCRLDESMFDRFVGMTPPAILFQEQVKGAPPLREPVADTDETAICRQLGISTETLRRHMPDRE